MKAYEKKRILVIEDEVHLAEGIKLNLTIQGYEVRTAATGTRGLEAWKTWNPDLIVLDIMLPEIDGLAILRNIRLEDERLPILILSAKSKTDDKIKGLSYGVDDYLTKPFELNEFLLRVERLVKRSYWNQENSDSRTEFTDLPTTYTFGHNIIHFDTAVAECQLGEINLTEQELKLFKLFLNNKGKPLSRSRLLEIGWGYSKRTTTRTIDNFIVRFRKYFEENPKHPKHFKSVRSVGYIFDPDVN